MSRAKKDTEKLPYLHEERMKEYACFRANLRMLRATVDLSAEALGKELGLPKYHRIIDLEYGRAAAPKLEEVQKICAYFKVSMDDLIYKKATISFQ